jgi:plasmid maintenance system killer protein
VKFRFTDSFVCDYRALPGSVKARTRKALRLLAEKTRHPSLHTQKIQGLKQEIWEMRVTREYRLTFQWEGDTLTLRRLATHNILRNP